MTVLVLHIRTCTAQSCSQTLFQHFDDAVITFILPDEGDHTCSKAIAPCSGGSRLFERGVPIKARVARLLGGSGGMPPQENFYDF